MSVSTEFKEEVGLCGVALDEKGDTYYGSLLYRKVFKRTNDGSMSLF